MVLLSHNVIQEVVTVYVWGLSVIVQRAYEHRQYDRYTRQLFVEVDLDHRLHCVSDVNQLEELE